MPIDVYLRILHWQWIQSKSKRKEAKNAYEWHFASSNIFRFGVTHIYPLLHCDQALSAHRNKNPQHFSFIPNVYPFWLWVFSAKWKRKRNAQPKYVYVGFYDNWNYYHRWIRFICNTDCDYKSKHIIWNCDTFAYYYYVVCWSDFMYFFPFLY